MGHKILTSQALQQGFKRKDQEQVKFPFLAPQRDFTGGMNRSLRQTPELAGRPRFGGGTQAGKGEVRGRWGGLGGGEGPREAVKRGGALLPGPAANQACGPTSRNPGCGFITCSPSTSLRATGRAPWKARTPPPLSWGLQRLRPQLQATLPPQAEPWARWGPGGPGAWGGGAQVGGT
ncbi:hypothetical protein P7K49_033697 [Saguinus oedipus]|uniref:Uncharacterized protein n=1 Tax=Saguinus oedipus TaxID=9490 RepID=A0ABQ9TTE6_SAGOE|nr:hypothetical protein P7K49_033697 [Saguinus oedipus]